MRPSDQPRNVNIGKYSRGECNISIRSEKPETASWREMGGMLGWNLEIMNLIFLNIIPLSPLSLAVN